MWKSKADTIRHSPVLAAKLTDQHSGEGWVYANFDYEVVSVQDDGSVVRWNDDTVLHDYTHFMEFDLPPV